MKNKHWTRFSSRSLTGKDEETNLGELGFQGSLNKPEKEKEKCKLRPTVSIKYVS